MHPANGARMSSNHGFSLVEVLVALLLTMVIMAAVFGLLTRGQESFRREPEVTDLNQSARVGLDMIARDLTLGGYKTPPASAILWANGGGLTPDELTIVYADPEVPISEPIKNPPYQTIKNSSTLNIDPNTLDPPQVDPEKSYTQGMVLFAIETGDCNGDGQVGIYPFELTQPPQLTSAGGSATLNLNHNPGKAESELNRPGGFNGDVREDCAVIGLFRVVKYRISPLPPTPNPTLERRDLSAATDPWIPVARNIENLQVQYAVGSSNVFSETPPAAPNPQDPNTWITQVQITVAGRTESTNLAGGSQGVFSAADTHLRKTFSTTVSLRNQVFAGEQLTSHQTYN